MRKKNNKDTVFSLAEVVVIVIIAILFGGVVGSLITISVNGTDENLDEFYSTYDSIVNEYYKKVDKSKLIDSAIEGMMNYLGDPYSAYMNSKESESFNQTVNGEYKGIGATIGMVSGSPTVVSLFDSSPAKEAGIKVGDVIVKVDGKSIKEKSLDQIITMIKKKSKVKLTVLRDGKEKSFNLKLDSVVIKSVSSKVFNNC